MFSSKRMDCAQTFSWRSQWECEAPAFQQFFAVARYTRNCQNKCSSNPPNLFFIKIKKPIVETRILKGSGPWCYTAFSYSKILKVCLMLKHIWGKICWWLLIWWNFVVFFAFLKFMNFNIFIWVLHTFRKCNEAHQCLQLIWQYHTRSPCLKGQLQRMSSLSFGGSQNWICSKCRERF